MSSAASTEYGSVSICTQIVACNFYFNYQSTTAGLYTYFETGIESVKSSANRAFARLAELEAKIALLQKKHVYITKESRKIWLSRGN